MVENALRHLTDKRRTSSSRTGKKGPIPPPDTDLEAPPLPPLHGGPSPPSGIQPAVTEETLTGRSRSNVNSDAILSNLGKVTAKGTAPILLPHPGIHKYTIQMIIFFKPVKVMQYIEIELKTIFLIFKSYLNF